MSTSVAPTTVPKPSLGLRVGDVVEVRSRAEILSTLADDGTLDDMPFMPEMFQFCGQRFTVDKRAHKTCDTVQSSGLRSLDNTVHLSNTRCDGSGHGGCGAKCQIFWKESWLKRVDGSSSDAKPSRSLPVLGATEEQVRARTIRPTPEGETGTWYRCQATDLRDYTRPLSPLDVRQYWNDVVSRNASLSSTLKGIGWRLFKWMNYNVRGYSIQMAVFNHLQRWRGGIPYLQLAGENAPTRKETLDLKPGEVIEVKSPEEIKATLNHEQKNRGLYFDIEMTPFCENRFEVGSRVNNIIEEKTGKMIKIPGDCIILAGVVCTGKYHANCPRAIPPYWREIWLRRPEDAPKT